MAITPPFQGNQQADLAHVDYNGISYRCDVYLNPATPTSNTIEAQIWTDGEDGQLVLLDASIVKTVVDANTVGDCPRVIRIELDSMGNGVVGFIIHWIEGDYEFGGTANLYRAMFDVRDISTGWVQKGAVVLHESALYDVDNIEGSLAEFVVSRRGSLATNINVTRYDAGAGPYLWTDSVWTANNAVTMADTVLAVEASDTDDCVLTGYAGAAAIAGTLQVIHLDSDGTNPSTSETFADLLDGDNIFTVVRIERGVADDYMVTAEFSNTADHAGGLVFSTYTRGVCWRPVTEFGLAQDHSMHCRNLHLVAAWSWAAGVLNTMEHYACVGFKSLTEAEEYHQNFGYIVRLDRSAIAAATGPNTVSPIPVAAFMDGSFDGRACGSSPAVTDVSIAGRRLNHSSHWTGPPLYTAGPAVKTVAFAAMAWSRLTPAADTFGGTTVEPAMAKVRMYRFHHEDPWIYRRDAREPATPATTNWSGAGHLAIAQPVETTGFLVFGGGVTQLYAGDQLHEHGFMWAPEILTAVVGNGSIEVAGDYYYTFNYAWTDGKGQLHRGPPSTPVMVTTPDNTSSVAMRVRCINLTMKDDLERYPAASPISIEGWRTFIVAGGIPEESGAVIGTYLFRRIFAGPTPGFTLQDTPVNDRNELFVTITDNQLNSIIVSNELMPFQLNTTTLQWSPPPPIPHVSLTVVANWNNVLWGYDRTDLRYSEPFFKLGTQYVGPEFNDTNVFALDGRGKVTALQPMDNAMIIFTRDNIFALLGEGNVGGVGSNLVLSVITEGTGCIEPRSVVLGPSGIFFQAHKGLYLLTRSHELQYIGAEVEDVVMAAGNIRGAVVLRNRSKVRFTLNGAPTALAAFPIVLEYDYVLGQWSTHPLPWFSSPSVIRLNEMQASTSWRGRSAEELHVFLQTAGLGIERPLTSTVYADEGVAATISVPLMVSVEWLHAAGVGNTKRLYEVGIQGERVNAGGMTVDAWFDLDGTWDDSGAADQTLPIASPAPANIRYRPRIQKCRGIRLDIYESGAVPQTENVRLVAMTLHFGVKERTQGRRNTA